LGHSDATYEEALHGIEAGAALGTHLFNGMRPLAHRDPGVIGALLQSDAAAVSIIPDGVHVHPAVLEIVARAKGAERTVLVTDALSPAVESERLVLGGTGLVLRDGAWYTPDGTLAGSAIGMCDAVRRMASLPGASLPDAVRMATATPARVLGMEGEIGVLAPGARGDIVVCESDFTVRQVFVDGQLAYEA
jgi:N-acetylglucosamine-6-phosphate deacetylase